MDLLLKVALITVLGCLAGRLAKSLRLSEMFGYLLVGIALGPSLLRVVSSQDLSALAIVGQVALAIVSFKIGSEFVFKDVRALGKSFVTITFAQVLGAVFVVFCALYFLFRQDVVFSVIMAAAAAATAPAASLMVIRQYRADGPVTQTLLPVIALDGVLGVVLFGVAISLAKFFLAAQDGGYSLWHLVSQPAAEIAGSLLLGAALGLVLAFWAKKAGDSDELLIITLGVILTSTALAGYWGLSPLLANFMLGLMLVNISPSSNRVFFSLNHFTPPVYLLFFTLVGASLETSGLINLLFIGLIYILARAAGKLLGSWLGAQGVQAEPTVQRCLGFALLPQGGISIALAVLVRQHLPQFSAAFTTIIVFTVLLFEVVGPVIARKAFAEAGEIGGRGRQFLG